MSIKRIKELVEIMNENDLAEVEVEQEGLKVRLIKTRQGAVEQVVMPTAAPPIQAASAATTVQEAQSRNSGLKEIKSPMVGTFYRAPSPDVDPYVQVGDVIQKGDVLCIVEAMKLMNEVKAEIGGRVVEIAVENADAVEYGQVLFVVEPL
jgi:acetyl-CoA carboxylase biotin carboxyl carrier protein